MASFWSVIKRYGPVALGVTESAVVAAHSAGLIEDSTFATLSALHGAAALPAIHGVVQQITERAIMKKATVQIQQTQQPPPQARTVEVEDTPPIVVRPRYRATPARPAPPVEITGTEEHDQS